MPFAVPFEDTEAVVPGYGKFLPLKEVGDVDSWPLVNEKAFKKSPKYKVHGGTPTEQADNKSESHCLETLSDGIFRLWRLGTYPYMWWSRNELLHRPHSF